MSRVLRPIRHGDHLSVVDHLDELRSRMIVCGVALLVAFGACFAQNHALLKVLNRALPTSSTASAQHGLAAIPTESVKERQGLLEAAGADRTLAGRPRVPGAERAAYAQAAQGLTEAARALPRNAPQQEKPVTIGVGEPFMTTLTVAGYFALLFSLPVLLYQAYAFFIPALSPDERRVALPLVTVGPLMFVAGVCFAYEVVLPPAVRFLQGYNSQDFNILVQAQTYYKFELFTMLGIGVAFQLPLVLLGLQRLGVINARTLTRNWRYATVILAVIGGAMPGPDPLTTALEMLPLVVLYLASIVLLKIADRRAARRGASELVAAAAGVESA